MSASGASPPDAAEAASASPQPLTSYPVPLSNELLAPDRAMAAPSDSDRAQTNADSASSATAQPNAPSSPPTTPPPEDDSEHAAVARDCKHPDSPVEPQTGGERSLSPMARSSLLAFTRARLGAAGPGSEAPSSSGTQRELVSDPTGRREGDAGPHSAPSGERRQSQNSREHHADDAAGAPRSGPDTEAQGSADRRVPQLERTSSRKASIHFMGGAEQDLFDADPEVRVSVRRRGIIHPEAAWKRIWDIALALLGLMQALSVPYRLAFGNGDSSVWGPVDVATDLLFIFSFGLEFRTAFIADGVVVDDPKRIAARYFHQRSFWIDLLAAAPLSIVQFAMGTNNAVLRFNKVLRIAPVLRAMRNMEENVNLDRTLLRSVNLIVTTFTISHCLACMYEGIGYWQGFGSTIFIPTEEQHNRAEISRYLFALYVVLGTMAGVPNKVKHLAEVPESHIDNLFSAFIMLVGALLFAFIIGSMTVVADATSHNFHAFQQSITRVQRFMKTFDIPEATRLKVWNYYAYMWERKTGYDNGNRLMIKLNKIPSTLRSDMAVHLPRSILLRAKLFEGLDRGFLTYLVDSLQSTVATPGEFICRAGDVGNKVYFLATGRASVLVGPEKLAVTHLSPGDSFGEYSLLLNSRRTAYIRAETYCDLYALSKATLSKAMQIFPKAGDELMRRVQEDRKLTAKQEDNLSAIQNSADHTRFRNMANRFRRLSVFNKVAAPEAETISHWLVLPFSRTHTIRDLILLVVHCYPLFIIPFRLAFLYYSDRDNLVVHMALDAVCDALLFVDMALSFRTAYVNDGFLVTNVRDIARRYLRGAFLLDLITAFPLDFIVYAAGYSRHPLWRLPRFLGAKKLYDISAEFIRNSARYRVLILTQLTFNIILLSHWAGCLYWIFSYTEGYGRANDYYTWWLPLDSLEDASSMHQYWRAFFFAFSVLTRSGKAFAAESDAEILFTLFTIMLGIVVVAYLIGNVATISSNLDVLATEFQQEKMFALSYCRNRNLPEDVVARVRSFYDQLWVTYGGVDPEEALSNLPRPLRSEILNCIAKRVVCTHSLFSEAPADFVQSLITKLKLQVFPLGEYIFRRGQVGDSMYFILVGEVGLYLPAAPRPAPRKRSLLRRNDVVPLGTESASAAKYVAAPVTATAPHEWEPRPPVALDRRAQCESVQPQQIGGAPFRVNLPGQPEVGDPAEPTSQGSATGQQQADAKDSSEPPSPGGSATSPARRSGIGLRTGVELKLMARRARKSSSSIQPMLFGAPLAQGLDELKSEEAFVVIGRGSFFGEGAMLTGIRNASARALSACQVLALNRQDFDTVFQPQPELLQALTQLSLRRFAGMRKVAEANMKRARELQAGK